MIESRGVIWLHIDDIPPTPTSHSVGEKRVLATIEDVGCNVTQIARTVLKAGEQVQNHHHLTMVEHFFFLAGKCNVMVEGRSYACKGGDYIFIPVGYMHEINVTEETEMITIGIATCSRNISE